MPVVRLGPGRRGAAGERGLTGEGGGDRAGPDTAALDALLRPALEAAWLVARSGERAAPPVPAPRPMRRLLTHARLTPAARATVRKVLDEDDGFRDRVADIVTEKAVGRAGWLFLTRPEGWADRLAELVAAEAESEEAARVAQEERTAARRLRGAEQALRRTEDVLTDTRTEAARAAAELARERHTRRAAEADAEALRHRAAALERDAAEVEALRRRVVELEADVAQLRAAAEAAGSAPGDAPAPAAPAGSLASPASPASAAPADRPVSAASPASPASSSPSPVAGESPPAGAPSPVAPTVDPVALAALHEAADTARALAVVLEQLASGAAAVAQSESPAPAPGPPSVERRTADRDSGPRSPVARGRPRRRPPALPPGILDDTPEAAEALVRTKGALLLVDGYNASLRWRHDLPVPELRRRLVAALDELAARTGVQVHVVFDGAEGQEPVAAGEGAAAPRTGVRVSFSPPDVEADDVILDVAATAPPSRPVLVASDDRRVQEGARARGAAVLSTAQLFAVLRRKR